MSSVSALNLDTGILKSVAAALSTRFSIPVTTIRNLLKDSTIQEWGKVRRVDSEEGDTIQSLSLGRKATDRRDATFIRVCNPCINTTVPTNFALPCTYAISTRCWWTNLHM
jgi:hypothetical protein